MGTIRGEAENDAKIEAEMRDNEASSADQVPAKGKPWKQIVGGRVPATINKKGVGEHHQMVVPLHQIEGGGAKLK